MTRSRCSRTASRTPAWSSPRSRRSRPAPRCGSLPRARATRACLPPGLRGSPTSPATSTPSRARTARPARSGRRSAPARSRTCSRDDPDRFERVVFLLPAALDRPIGDHDACSTAPPSCWNRCRRTRRSTRSCVESGRGSSSTSRAPGLREFDLLLWQDMNPQGVARAIREVVRDVAIDDRGAAPGA